MADKLEHKELVNRLDTPGWRLVADDADVSGSLKDVVAATHARRSEGKEPGLIENIEARIELDMLQIQDLWHHLGLPTT